jgi:thiol-disulfide isomerase/thioredoxin
MMKPHALAIAMVSCLVARVAYGQVTDSPVTLKVGDAAPPLTVGSWVKGDPVKNLEPGKLYVIEFWATWCVPCKRSIPHLTEMTKENPDVTFIGCDCWEKDESLVAPFVQNMGDKMDYHVATDSRPGKEGSMATNWMKAAGRNGIPAAFLVDKDGKIAWIGHPMAMEPVLAKVKAGTYDAIAEAEAQSKVDTLTKQLSAAAKAKDTDRVLSTTKQIRAIRPAMDDEMTTFEFEYLLKNGHADDARSRAKALASTSNNSSAVLNVVGWDYANEASPTSGDLEIARDAIGRALDLTHGKDPAVLDTSARLFAVQKEWSHAVESEQKAVNLATGDMQLYMKKVLAAYEKEQVPSTDE